MAASQANKVVNLIAGEDLRSDLYEVLAIEDDSDVGKVVKATALNQVIVGVLAENPNADASTDGETVAVTLLEGVIKVKAGATITAGDLVVVDTGTAGRVASGGATVGALAADSFSIGVALQSAVDGDIFEVLAQPASVAAT